MIMYRVVGSYVEEVKEIDFPILTEKSEGVSLVDLAYLLKTELNNRNIENNLQQLIEDLVKADSVC